MKRSETFIVTKRLWLRQMDETDAESVAGLRSDENVYKYFLNPVKLTVEMHREWYREQYCKSDTRIDWIAVDDGTGEFIGVYGAKITDSDTVEISYITADLHKHFGYASEAVEAIINWCENKWSLYTFVTNIHKENIASIRFAEKLGFAATEESDEFIRLERRKDVVASGLIE